MANSFGNLIIRKNTIIGNRYDFRQNEGNQILNKTMIWIMSAHEAYKDANKKWQGTNNDYHRKCRVFSGIHTNKVTREICYTQQW